jgi:hypothetical protein
MDSIEGFGQYVYYSGFSIKKQLLNYYLGEFVNNNREGFGIHYYSDGSIYIGYWLNGLKEGKAYFIDNLGHKWVRTYRKNHMSSE